VKIKTYAEHDLGPALARQVAENLQAAIDTKGRASIAVPGGSTPGPFLSALSLEALDWEKVTVTLSDERCVPAGHARSNQTLVTKSLLRGAAQAARFIPLHADTLEKEDIETALTTHALPLDVSVLGMGNDLHTASLFPGTPRLADLLNPNGKENLASVSPPNADEPRVTLTGKALITAQHTYLLIKGAEKRAALERAMNTADRNAAPIRAVLENAPSAVIFYAA